MFKVKTQKEIKEVIDNLRKNNPKTKIVTTNGSFDLLHSGHLSSLSYAKSLGDILVVGLNSDTSVRTYKSSDRPIIPQDERAKMLSALEIVDYVIIFDEPEISQHLINTIKPDFHVKSKSGYKGFEGPVLKKYGGKLVLIEDVPGLSTTSIIEKIKKLPDEN